MRNLRAMCAARRKLRLQRETSSQQTNFLDYLRPLRLEPPLDT